MAIRYTSCAIYIDLTSDMDICTARAGSLRSQKNLAPVETMITAALSRAGAWGPPSGSARIPEPIHMVHPLVQDRHDAHVSVRQGQSYIAHGVMFLFLGASHG
ncbi:hypothetical protein [Rhodovulum strictum]|uniref:hypothetical protein n=1 Tax=Rhodovulum strictum TaxID=58314 RepID=UPI001B873C7D|nr:hypothetical protein [Rhodovulum strictum]